MTTVRIKDAQRHLTTVASTDYGKSSGEDEGGGERRRRQEWREKE